MGSMSIFTDVTTIAVVAAVAGISYRSDRVYRRWVAEISPLAGPRARVGSMRLGYRKRRKELGVVAIIIIEVLQEIDRATRSDGTRNARLTNAGLGLAPSADDGMYR